MKNKNWLIIGFLVAGGIAAYKIIKAKRPPKALWKAAIEPPVTEVDDQISKNEDGTQNGGEDSATDTPQTKSHDSFGSQVHEIDQVTDTEIGEGKRLDGKVRIPPRRGLKVQGETSLENGPQDYPQVACWKDGGHWTFGIQFEENPGTHGLLVKQGGGALKADSQFGDLRYRLLSISQVIEIEKSGQKSEINLLGDRDKQFLIFKVRKNWDGMGHLVRRISSGCFLVLAPSFYRRDVQRSGDAPVPPEPSHLDGYHVHYFFLDRDGVGSISFLIPGGIPSSIESIGGRFVLGGKRIDLDASEDKGTLFIGDPPILTDQSGKNWEDIGIVVYGEEGIGIGRYRKGILHPELNGEIQLHDLEGRGHGWYFLRVYNQEIKLIETFDFRYANFLKGIAVSAGGLFPSKEGHRSMELVFEHEQGVRVLPPDEATGDISSEGEKSIFQVEAHPDLDVTKWEIFRSGSDHPLEVTIALDRLWWAVGGEEAPPDRWSDKPIRFRLDDFRATSHMSFWVKSRALKREGLANIGFAPERTMMLRQKAGHVVCTLPLRVFCDDPALRLVGDSRLIIKICNDGDGHDQVVGLVSLTYKCSLCDFSTGNESQARQHFSSCHRDAIREAFPHVDYEEMRMRDVSLPKGIYKCHYCKYHVVSDDMAINPTSSIINHITHQCKNVDRSNPFQVRYQIQNDVDIIRREIIHNLPRIYKCTKCSNRYVNPTENELLSHLSSVHPSMLYLLVSVDGVMV